MTMNFRLIKASIVTLLGTSAAGRYRTIGFQEQGQAATEVKDDDRSVQVYYRSGDLPKQGGGLSGPFMHNTTYDFDLTVSKPALVDLTIMQNPLSTAGQYAAALAAMQQSSELADTSFDELADVIFQIIMNAENIDLGMSTPVANRWIRNIQKDDPIPRGELVVLTGSMQLTCKIDEQVSGEALVAAVPPVHDVTLETYQTDSATADPAKAGVITGG